MEPVGWERWNARENKKRERERERKPRKKRQHISKSQSGSRWRARVLCLLKKRGRRRQKKISFDGIITGEYLYDFAESTGADEGTKRQRDDHHRLPDFAVSCGLFADGPRSAKKRNFARYVSLTKRLITAKVALLPALEKFLNST